MPIDGEAMAAARCGGRGGGLLVLRRLLQGNS